MEEKISQRIVNFIQHIISNILTHESNENNIWNKAIVIQQMKRDERKEFNDKEKRGGVSFKEAKKFSKA